MFFFFFKQKTAYEMRISDWSSDVCSSDLVRREPDSRGAGRQADQRATDPEPAAHDDRARRAARTPGAMLEHSRGGTGCAEPDRQDTHQIGRASCRERVWQDV